MKGRIEGKNPARAVKVEHHKVYGMNQVVAIYTAFDLVEGQWQPNPGANLASEEQAQAWVNETPA